MSLLNPFTWFTPAVKAVNGVVKTAFGSRHDREQNAAMLDAAVQGQYAAEFHDRTGRTWFDSLVDGVNRLVRPTLAIYICWMVFALPLIDLDLFMQIITAYGAVPEALWGLAGIIITFFFGGRMQYKNLQFKQSDIQRVREVKQTLEEMRRPEEREIEGLPWLDNPAIKKWKEN